MNGYEALRFIRKESMDLGLSLKWQIRTGNKMIVMVGAAFSRSPKQQHFRPDLTLGTPLHINASFRENHIRMLTQGPELCKIKIFNFCIYMEENVISRIVKKYQ